MCDNDVKIYKKSDDTVSFARIALALASDYNSVYLISTKDDSYIEYSISPEDRTLTKASWGDDFYADVIPNSQALVYHEDLNYFQSTFRKENVIAALENGKSFSLQYRLVIDNKPQYYYLKTIFDSSSASEFIVIGVQNVDAQVRRLKAVEAENETYSFISRALASRYEVIYYVDTETNEYLEYSSSEDYSKLGTKKNGRDFFKTAASDINKFVYHEDRRHLLYSIDKGVMMKNLETSGFLSYTYRQTLNDRLQYVRMVIVRPYKGSKNIVIGVQNVDDQVRREQVMAEESATFGEIIRALAMRYEVIYYVNTITDDFKEYTSSEKYAKLNIGDTGTDFFGETQRNLKRDIYPEDYPMMAESMTKTTLLKNISETGSTSLNYRLILDGRPQYVTLFAIRPKEDSEHIIIAVANVDAAKRRENAFREALGSAMDLASRDALTRVKNKHAYVQEEEKLDQQISEDVNPEFAVVVCDINGLKAVNDTQGHRAGDEFIQTACNMICLIFKHSPVFRIGGDEFAVLLKGHDFECRDQLMTQLDDTMTRNRAEGRVTVAFGISDFNRGVDMRMQDVFERADAKMYTYKRKFKE